MSKLSLADALILTLKDLGVNPIFGVGGANIEHFYDSIYRLGGEDLQLVAAKSEYSAAFMADGLARAHNTLGVCCSTSGGGMMNLAIGIAESFADQVPILAIVGQPPLFLQGRGAFQDSSGKTNSLNAVNLFKSISKYTAQITSPDQFWHHLHKALRHIFLDAFGPSVLLIPRDLFTEIVPKKPVGCFSNLATYRQQGHPIQSDITPELCQLFATACHPLVIIGKHAHYEAEEDDINRFVTHINAKVGTTIGNINGFDHRSKNFLGLIGICGHKSAHDYLQQKADLVIILEDDMTVMSTTSILEKLNALPTVFIGKSAIKASASINVDFVVQGLLSSCLDTLCDHITPKKNQSSSLFKKTNCHVNREQISYHTVPIDIKVACSIIEFFLEHIQHSVFDAGNCTSAALHYLTLPKHVTTTIALGMGGMGYSIPAAIGIQLKSDKSHKTLAFLGDGSFLISGLEIQTAIEYKCPILFIIFNNNKHGMCQTRQELYFSNRVIGSRYETINIAHGIEKLNGPGVVWTKCVTTAAQLEEALKDYYSHCSYTTGVLEIKIISNEMPPFIPFLKQS